MWEDWTTPGVPGLNFASGYTPVLLPPFLGLHVCPNQCHPMPSLPWRDQRPPSDNIFLCLCAWLHYRNISLPSQEWGAEEPFTNRRAVNVAPATNLWSVQSIPSLGFSCSLGGVSHLCWLLWDPMVMQALWTRQSAGHFFSKVLLRRLCRPKVGIGIFYLQWPYQLTLHWTRLEWKKTKDIIVLLWRAKCCYIKSWHHGKTGRFHVHWLQGWSHTDSCSGMWGAPTALHSLRVVCCVKYVTDLWPIFIEY